MCKFCDDLKWKTYIIPQRNTFADDNQCEFGSPVLFNDEVCDFTCIGCDGCKEENRHFSLISWENNLKFDYVSRIKNLIIEPSSESIKINFCPWCGRLLTDNPVDFEQCCLGGNLDVEN